MGNYSIVFLFLFFSPLIHSDEKEKGQVTKVYTGNLFEYAHFTELPDRRKLLYKLVCTKAYPLNTKKGREAKKFLEKKILGKPIQGLFGGTLDNLQTAKRYLEKNIIEKLKGHETINYPFGIYSCDVVDEEATEKNRIEEAKRNFNGKKQFIAVTMLKAGLLQKYKDHEECYMQ
jgi:hypothetical protein